MSPRWFMMMAMWARRPPSAQRVKFVLAIIAICIALAAWSHFFGWPEALTVNRLRP